MASVTLLRGSGADGNDNLIIIKNVKSNKPEYTVNGTAPFYINNGTVEITFYEAGTTNELAGETWPLVCAYVPNSEGWYAQTLQDTVPIPASKYDFKLVIEGDGLKATATGTAPVIDRKIT